MSDGNRHQPLRCVGPVSISALLVEVDIANSSGFSNAKIMNGYKIPNKFVNNL